ncbi:hypothetical protein ACIPX0_31715 [Streptomyces sp. NPDC090075]
MAVEAKSQESSSSGKAEIRAIRENLDTIHTNEVFFEAVCSDWAATER